MNFELCRNFFASWQNCRIFVGFSGGADSTAALLTALYFREEFSLDLQAVHFDHHLRAEESDADVLFCREFCRKHSVELTVIDLDISPGGGLEERARQARLKHWQKLAAGEKKCAVILGHHCDDRIETFFLRMLRGANLSGLLSPKEMSVVDGVTFLRPLLRFSRQEIETFLTGRGFCCWREDSSNAVADCGRNILRLDILPKLYALFGGAGNGVRHCVENLAQDADFLEMTALQAFDIHRVQQREYWLSLHPAIAARVLRLWLDEIPSRPFLLAFSRELELPPPDEPRTVVVSLSKHIVFQKDKLFLKKKNNIAAAEWSLSAGPCVWGDWLFEAEETDNTAVLSKFEAVFDAHSLGNTLVLTPPLPGEEMSVFGSGKKIKVKKLRVDSKIPALYALPVLKNTEGDILWAPGIKHSSVACVTGETKKIIRLKASSAKFRVGIGID